MPGFARIDNLKGTATTKGHTGELEFHALMFAAAGGEKAAPVFDHIRLTRSSDLASPALLEAFHRGLQFDEARLTVGTIAAGPSSSEIFRPALTLTLGEVTVTRIQTVWTDEGRPTEEIALGYRRLSWSAVGADGQTASFSGEVRPATATAP